MKISRGIRAEEIRRRRQPVLVQGIASADAALWLAISTAVESLSWDEVELNEVGGAEPPNGCDCKKRSCDTTGPAYWPVHNDPG